MKLSVRYCGDFELKNFSWRILERVLVGNIVNIRNECLFFWVHGVWIVARNKQITREPLRGSTICLSRATIHIPWTQKKRHSFLKWPWLWPELWPEFTSQTLTSSSISTFEPLQVGLSYFKYMYSLQWDLSVGIKSLKPSDLDYDFWPNISKIVTFFITFEPLQAGFSYFACVFLVMRPFSQYQI